MKETMISVTEVARNLADYVNRAHSQNVSFILLKNRMPVARLSPEKLCTGRDLANALAKTDLSVTEAHSWHKDLAAARKKPSGRA